MSNEIMAKTKDEQLNIFLDSDVIADDFFMEIVEKKLNIKRETFKLRLVLVTPATGKNENFVSAVFRAKIKIEIIETNVRQSVDVIIKVLLSVMKELKEYSVFPRERFIYENVLSSFEKVWLDRTGEEIQFGPKSIKFETDPYEIIVLDDLRSENYEMLNRKIGLTFDQSRMLLAKLAKFHAASAIRYQQDGKIQDYFDRKAMSASMPNDGRIIKTFERIHKVFADAVNNYGDCDAPYKKVARWNLEKLANTWVQAAEPMLCGFQILNHGDIWLNNILFKSDNDSNPLDVSLIDFQASFWGSPAADIVYFMLSSVADSVKIDRFDDLIESYHEELVSSLKKLKFDQHIPTLPELHVDLLDKGGFGSSCLMFTLFIVKNDSPEEINLEAMMTGDTEDVKRHFNGVYYKNAVKLWLHFLNKRGFLDALIVENEQHKDKEK